MTNTACTNELTIQKFVPAPPEKVFDAWVIPQMRKKWWAAQAGMTCDRCEIDAQLGGRYRINMKSPDGGHEYVVVGEFTELNRPTRLAMTWSWEPGSEDPAQPGSFATGTTVTIDFEPADGGTHVRLRHTGFTDPAQRDNHNEGWAGCLEQLARQH